MTGGCCPNLEGFCVSDMVEVWIFQKIFSFSCECSENFSWIQLILNYSFFFIGSSYSKVIFSMQREKEILFFRKNQSCLVTLNFSSIQRFGKKLTLLSYQCNSKNLLGLEVFLMSITIIFLQINYLVLSSIYWG